jgi:hypothetical protein
MWMSDEIFQSIAEFLDFRGIRNLFSTSKKAIKALKNKFTKESHPHALAYMTLKIFEARRNGPHTPFQMLVRDAETIRFNDLDHEQTGWVTMFWVRVADDGKSISIRVSYVANDEGFSTVDSSIEVVVTPSETTPFRSGAIHINRIRDTTTTATLEYADGFDYHRVLELCPLQLDADAE